MENTPFNGTTQLCSDTDPSAIDFHVWKSRMSGNYARIEQAAGDLLEALAQDANDDSADMSHGLKQRLNRVLDAMDLGTPDDFDAGGLRKKLQELDALLRFRNVISHATGRLILNEAQWTWLYSHRPSDRDGTKEKGWISSDEAEDLSLKLHPIADSVVRRLSNWRQAISK